MVSFTCNLCGRFNNVEVFATEPASCSCGSNVRSRALIHLLSLELFGHSLILTEFPKLKSIRGLGMTDKECYASILKDKFDYTNTQYDREPRFDFTESHPKLAGMYDFILSADVLEHVAPPVERVLDEVHSLLKPCGFFGITIFCNPQDDMREHFPELRQYRTVPLGDSTVLINRRADGTLEISDDLIFHGGSGATLEMREFGATELRRKLAAAGFHEFEFLTDNLPEIGVLFDEDVSQPLIARKEPFVLSGAGRSELVEQWRCAQQDAERERQRAAALSEQVRQAAGSRWLGLGRRLGLGPSLLPPR